MPARSIANATISFGLVSVPINIFSSAESKASVSFNMLHKKCKGRLKQQYICPRDDNEVVTRDETVKGYEFAKDQYVVPLEEKATSSITFSSYGSARHQARSDSVSGCRRNLKKDVPRLPVVCTASWGYLRLHKLDYDEGEGSGPPAMEAFVKAGAG
jgi:hypothetical protein